jgi:hypothetical protein
VERESLLLHAQALATRPYPEPDKSSSCLLIPLLENLFYYYLSSTPTSSKWFLSISFFCQNPVRTSLFAFMQFIFHLRDTNLPKFVFEDAPLFLGLIRDLFPGVECPHVGCTDLKAAVETSLAAEGYVVLPAQVSSNR